MTAQTNPFIQNVEPNTTTKPAPTSLTPEVLSSKDAGTVQPTPVLLGTQQPQKVPGMQTVPSVTQPEGVMNLTFDDDIKINTLDKLPQLSKDETSRIGFILFDENNSPMIKMSYYFYDDVTKKLFLAPKNKDVLTQVVNKLGEPKIRFGTPVIKYQTDQYGNLPAEWSYNIFALIFSTDKFPILKALHKEWGLNSHDILMTCTEEKYQKVSMNIARESLWRSLPENFLKDIHEKATAAYEKYINRMMGRPMSDNEILSILGLAGPINNQMMNTTNPFPTIGQVAAPVGQLAGQVGVGAPSTAEFSHLVNQAGPQ